MGADPTPPPPPDPLPDGIALGFTLHESLLDYGLEFNQRHYTSLNMPGPVIPAIDRLADGIPTLEITPHLINRYDPTLGTDESRFARRLPPLARREPVDAWWWVYGIINDRNSWILTASPNTEALTAQGLGERLRADPRSVTMPSRDLYLHELCIARPGDTPPVYTVEPVPVAFADGDGWATLSLCINYGWWVGDGPECSGCGTDYTAVLWYSFHGITQDEAYILHLTVPFEGDELPSRSAQIITCQINPDEAEMFFSPALDQWETLGWLPGNLDTDPVGYCYPRLTNTALEELVEEIVQEITMRRDGADRNDPLTAIFNGLNATFATLRLDISAIPPPVPVNE